MKASLTLVNCFSIHGTYQCSHDERADTCHDEDMHVLHAHVEYLQDLGVEGVKCDFQPNTFASGYKGASRMHLVFGHKQPACCCCMGWHRQSLTRKNCISGTPMVMRNCKMHTATASFFRRAILSP